MTLLEKAWFNRLYKLLHQMPKNVEIQVHHSMIQMNKAGARKANFERTGNADNVDSLDEFSTRATRVYSCSESM